MIDTLENRIEAKYPAYTRAQAHREADRCLYCYDPPGVKACPTAIDIPTFIKKIAVDNIVSAAKTILSANILGHSCAKVCPVEVLCAGACIYNELDELPIAIGRLQGFATENAQKTLNTEQILGKRKPLNNKHIALIGAGPASLATAGMLNTYDAVLVGVGLGTDKSLDIADLDKMVPMPRVANYSTNGGYCGPAVKPIALHMLGALARCPHIKHISFSGISGISNWRDAVEFIAMGASSVQVCTAVMHYGFRIVEDMIDGLSAFLKSKSLVSVEQLRGQALSAFKEWGDLAYRVVAKIDENMCIGCNKCYVACLDGSHQCIYLPGMNSLDAQSHGHPHPPKQLIFDAHQGQKAPFVDKHECVGCNLCQLVCPVEGCITMIEQEIAGKHFSFKEKSAG